MIPYSRQKIYQDDINEVKNILRSDFLTQGPTVPKFEKAIADYCGVSYSVAVNSATSALHISCLALGLGRGDTLWTSPNSFVASANSALYCGAKVDFVDIDMNTYNISIDALEEKLIKAKKTNSVPKVVMPVHFAGLPCNMPAIFNLSKKYGFKILEDASHAIGSSYDKIKIGSCKHSDIAVFSFHPVKIITTAEGGMALTKEKNIAEKLRKLMNHGITKDKKFFMKRNSKEIWNYQQLILGYNYRMNDIQAALGLSQMKKLDKFIEKRNEIANYYNQKLKTLPIILPKKILGYCSSYHLYVIRVPKKKIDSQSQKNLYESLLSRNIGVNVHYIPIHRQPFYEKLGFKKGSFPEAEKLHKECISLPIYPSLSKLNQFFVTKTLKEIFKK